MEDAGSIPASSTKCGLIRLYLMGLIWIRLCVDVEQAAREATDEISAS